jgi:hypothetical protein
MKGVAVWAGSALVIGLAGLLTVVVGGSRPASGGEAQRKFSSVSGTLAAKVGPASHCARGEQVLFSCRLGRKLVSVCSTGDTYTYRYGEPAKPEIEIRSNGDDGKAYQNNVVGGGHGSENTIRFVRNDYSYIVSSGEAGVLTDVPGKRWSVLNVEKGHEVVARHECQNVSPQDKMLSELPDDPDEHFNQWY